MQSINSTDSLTIALGAAPATNLPNFWGSYMDSIAQAITADMAISPTALSADGVTAVPIFASPAAGTTRHLVAFTMTNTDTAAISVRVLLNGVVGIKYTMQPGDVMQFGKNTDEWTVKASDGAQKQGLSAKWGQLGGSLADQTDVAAAINAKQDAVTNGIVTTTVNAGIDQAVTLPATASLAGTAADDGSPAGTYTTTWSKVSGPGTVTFGNAAILSTTATFSTAGTYVLRLTANDGNYNTSDDMTVVAS
jgi:hypothetical protein